MTRTVDRYLSVTDTAKLIREALRATFPGVKFSVRSDKYAGGASINISWTDGPLVSEVDPVVKRYEGKQFDGMRDIAEYLPPVLVSFDGALPVSVSFGADYVFTDRELSPEYRARLAVIAQSVLDDNAETAGRVFDPSSREWLPTLGTEWGTVRDGTPGELIGFLAHYVPA